MFSLPIDDDIQLALVHPSFAASYLQIVRAEREYLGRWLGWAINANDESFFASFITMSLHHYADGKSLTCAMFYKDALVGNVSFNSIDHELKKVEVGYWLSEAYQGHGIVTRSVSALIEYAFSGLGMEKVQICAAEENKASRGVCERLNMTLEGIITREEKVGDRTLDIATYGLSRTDWLAAR